MKALNEYNALQTISKKLDFNPTGRPGADKIRADQARLADKIKTFKKRTRNNLNSANTSFKTVHQYASHQQHSPGYGYYNRVKWDFMNFHDVTSLYYLTRSQYQELLSAMRLAERVKNDELRAYHERDKLEGSPRELLGLSITAPTPKSIGPWFYVQGEEQEKDYSYYSKGWHRRYGPKISTYRQVQFARMFRGKPKRKIIDVKTWTGDWLAKAALEAGIVKPIKSITSLKIRLNNVYDAKLIDNKRGYKIYSRTLLGTHIDFVIVSPMGVVYHDADRKNLISGLHIKVRATANKLALPGSNLIDWAACKKLGFCDPGINEFCDIFGFSTDGRYTAQEIERAVRKRPHLATPFLAELKTLASAYSYSVSWV